jgi:hypothetical protein
MVKNYFMSKTSVCLKVILFHFLLILQVQAFGMSSNMAGGIIIPGPFIFNVSGSDTLCSYYQNDTVYLSGSEIDVTYFLIHNGSNTFYTQLGNSNGTPLYFPEILGPGIYQILAIHDFTGLSSLMNGEAIMTLAPLPALTSLNIPNACNPGSLLLQASFENAGVEWYDQPVDFPYLDTGNTFTTPFIASNTFFYIRPSVEGCYYENYITIPVTIGANAIQFADADGDGFGDPTDSIVNCNSLAGYVSNSLDCDDNNQNVWNSDIFYVDIDQDGFHSSEISLCYGTNTPVGYSAGTLGEDCDDNNANIWVQNIVYVDLDGDGYHGSTAVGCFGIPLPADHYYFSAGQDCDDNNPALYNSQLIYLDLDGDTYHSATLLHCTANPLPPDYYTFTEGFDCDDNNISIGQGIQYFKDNDQDGYYVFDSIFCSPPVGPEWVLISNTSGDCDDNDINAYQLNTVFIDVDGDGYDNGTVNLCFGDFLPAGYNYNSSGSDCDDNDFNVQYTQGYYLDADGDGFYLAYLESCTNPGPDWQTSADQQGDCNDNDENYYYSSNFYIDTDGDGYDNGQEVVCYGYSTPSGYSGFTNGPDCDDSNDTLNTGLTYYLDADNDGYFVSSIYACSNPGAGYTSIQGIQGDCNDNDNTLQVGIDYYLDADNDGHYVSILYACNNPGAGYTTSQGILGDCDDNNNNVFVTQILYIDNDNDGADNGTDTLCIGSTIPAGYSLNSTGNDCDDNNNALQAGLTYYLDADNDGCFVSSLFACNNPGAGYTSTQGISGDCDDNNNNVFITQILYIDNDNDGADNGTDTLCIGSTIPAGYSLNTIGSDCDDNNNALQTGLTYYLDADNDGYFVNSIYACSNPGAGYTTTQGISDDCNDNDNGIYVSQLLYIDNDNDGADNGTITLCIGANIPSGYSLTTSGSDCDDNNNALQIGINYYLDADNDGYYVSSIYACNNPGTGYTTTQGISGDCDDGNDTLFNSIMLYIDLDGDGFDNGNQTFCLGLNPVIPTGYSVNTLGSDCIDTMASVNSAAIEICGNSIDDDCDGFTDEGCCTVPIVDCGTLLSNAHCNSSTGSLEILAVNGGVAPYQYSLDSINYSTTNLFSNLIPGNYTLWVKDNLGCTYHEAFSIIVLPDPVANAGPDKEVCIGSFVALYGSGVGFYSWDIPGANQSSVAVSPQQTTTYTLTLSDANGCSSSDQVTVTVLPKTEIFPATDTLFLCESASPIELNYYEPQGGTYSSSIIKSGVIETENVFQGFYSASYKIMDSEGCFWTKNFVIDYGTASIQLPEIITGIKDKPIDIYPEINYSRGSRNTEYLWEPAALFNNPNLENPQITSNKDTLISITATTDFCTTYKSARMVLTEEGDLDLIMVNTGSSGEWVLALENGSDNRELEVFIFDAKGAIIYQSIRSIVPGKNKFPFSLAVYPDGVYFIKAKVSNLQKTIKAVKTSR